MGDHEGYNICVDLSKPRHLILCDKMREHITYHHVVMKLHLVFKYKKQISSPLFLVAGTVAPPSHISFLYSLQLGLGSVDREKVTSSPHPFPHWPRQNQFVGEVPFFLLLWSLYVY